MDANLLEVGSKLLAKVIAEEGVQWSPEMTHPIHFHHLSQHDLIFRRFVRKIIETYLGYWIQGTQARILDPPRGVGTYLRGEQVKAPCGRKKEREDGLLGGLPKNTTQFRKQIPLRCSIRYRRSISEDVGLVKRKNEERPSRKLFIAIQQIAWVYELSE